MSELTLSVAAEINSALQTIIGHCDLIGRGQHRCRRCSAILQTIMGQAQRIAGLLDKMRSAANERLRETTRHDHARRIAAESDRQLEATP